MTSARRRVLILDNSIGVTGALKAINGVAQSLKSDFDFNFILPARSGGIRMLKDSGVTVSTLNMKEISRSIVNIIAYFPFLFLNAFRLKTFIRTNRIDLVHVNDIFNLLPAVARMLGSRIPYVVHVRFLPDKFPALLFRTWLTIHVKQADAIVVVSEAVRKQLPVHPKIICIPDGMPMDQKVLVGPLHLEAPRTFLYLSNFIQGKGQDHALEAFRHIHHDIPGWKLRFVGGDMGLNKNRLFMENIRDNARRFGISDKIEWVSFVDDVESEYTNADIVINFSESESFSMTCLEALYYQKPLIATDCGGPSEIIGNDACGVLVPNKDVRAMSAAMMRLARDPQLRTNLGRNGHQRVYERFNVDVTSGQLKKVYLSALNKI
jgi:glycosyltransferase involved in cell wall biosynthesis